MEQNAAAAAETNAISDDQPASAGETTGAPVCDVRLTACKAPRCFDVVAAGNCRYGGTPAQNVELTGDQLREPAGLHPCESCGVELDGDDVSKLCGECLGDDEPAGEDLGSYVAMFREYLRQQRLWIGPAQQPLVFHMMKLCQKLDADPDAPASLSSAYLQAFRRLDLQRPGNKQPAGAAGDLPGQGSIFDELD